MTPEDLDRMLQRLMPTSNSTHTCDDGIENRANLGVTACFLHPPGLVGRRDGYVETSDLLLAFAVCAR